MDLLLVPVPIYGTTYRDMDNRAIHDRDNER